MEYKIKLNRNNLFVTFEPTENPKFAGSRNFLANFLEAPVWQSATRILLNLSKIRIGNLTGDEIRQFIDTQNCFFKKMADCCFAVVVSRPVDFGVARMGGAIVENLIPCYQIFYTVEEAVEWLGHDRTAGLVQNVA